MKLATKKQLDRARDAQREVERLSELLDTPGLTSDEWNAAARAFADARAERSKANQVLANIEAFNARAAK